MQMQICVLVIAPTFFSAALYWAGGLIIAGVAPSTSSRWLSPKRFKIVFITADVVALVIQGVGGGLAGSAAADGGGSTLDIGSQCVFHFFLTGTKLTFFRFVASCSLVSSSSSS
jgi:hypothetical protein